LNDLVALENTFNSRSERYTAAAWLTFSKARTWKTRIAPVSNLNMFFFRHLGSGSRVGTWDGTTNWDGNQKTQVHGVHGILNRDINNGILFDHLASKCQ